MKTRRSTLLTAPRAALILSVLAAFGAPARAQEERAGIPQTIPGVVVTLEDLRSRPETPPFATPREASPRRTFNGSAAPLPPALSASEGNPSGSSPQKIDSIPDLPQALVDEILGPKITDTPGFVPPDTMGAVGPTQFLFSVNGRFRGFNKNTPHTQIFNFDQQTFWGSTADPAGVSDAHVRYDRTTQRWFITEIDVPVRNNHILLAVSSGSDLSTATWTQYRLPGTGASAATDQNCFADYDTPGIDQNAIYIGANMFGGGASPCSGGNYKHSNLYVIQKAPTLTGTANLTTFYGVVSGIFGIATIQGVDSFDSLSTGYAIAVKETESPRAHLNVWQINNPGTASPTLSGPTAVVINPENDALGGVLSANNVASTDPTRPMDDLDDRLFAAVIRNGHLWSAHNVAVDSTGNSNGGTLTRDAVRWYDINVPALTLHQSGTVFDSASSGFLHYWMGTVMASGQGHVALGLNRANSTTVVQAGAVGRLASDPLGTMQGFSLFQSSTADAYDDSAFVPNPANRWGDYTYTSLDPCDDMTMWTTQEYVAGPTAFGLPIDWGVAAEKLQAPPPAAPASASPSTVAPGQASVSVVVTGTSASGSGFYDTPSTVTDPCRLRIGASVSGGVTVNSVTFTDPTHVTLNLSTVSASLGPQSVTITNPDGQTAMKSSILTVCPVINLTPATLPAGTVGTAYSPTTLTPSAGTAPFTFNVTGLPAGMTPTTQVVGPSVTIGGTPTASFSGMINVAGHDANGCAFSQDFSLTVSCPPPPSTTITAPAQVCSLSVGNTASVPDAGAGATYAWTISNGTITAGQGTRTITFSAGTSGPISLGVTVTATPGCPAMGNTDVTVNSACASFYTLTPCRIVDTRDPDGPYGGPAIMIGPDRAFVLAGQCGIPMTAKAVSVNVTITQPSALGDLRTYPGGSPLPLVSTINYQAGQTRANNAVSVLGPSGDLVVHCDQISGTVHLIIDTNGYFQ